MNGFVSILLESRGLFAGTAMLVGLCVGSFLNVVIYRLPKIMERQWALEIDDYLRERSAKPSTDPTSMDAASPNVAHAPAESKASALIQPAAGDARSEGSELTTAADAPTKIQKSVPTQRFNLAFPASACTACQAPIRWWQNIPVVSYVALRGRCACGKSPISARYPAVELLTGLLSALVAYQLGFGAASLGALVLTWYLIALAFIDADTTLLPDVLTLPLLWGGIVLALLGWGFTDLRSSVIGAMAGYLVLWTVFWAFKICTGKEGMGYGDFKLLAALGAWLGWQMLLPIVLLSAVAGSVIGIAGIVFAHRGRDFQMPFGPYLAIAGFVALLWGRSISRLLLPGVL